MKGKVTGTFTWRRWRTLFALRSKQASTKFSLFFLVFDRHQRLVSSMLPEKDHEPQIVGPDEMTEEDHQIYVDSVSLSIHNARLNIIKNVLSKGTSSAPRNLETLSCEGA